ncbi:hypothetical protein KIPB_015718, partial [Kipferlia bialata]|eukprot:g15718.t1
MASHTVKSVPLVEYEDMAGSTNLPKWECPPALAYAGALTAEGGIPDIPEEGEESGYAVLAVGCNKAGEGHVQLLTQSESGSLSAESVDCSFSLSHASATRAGDYVLIFGGETDGVARSSLHEYSVGARSVVLIGEGEGARGEWPCPRTLNSAFCLNGMLYIAGGVSAEQEPLKDCWRYNTADGTWTQE